MGKECMPDELERRPLIGEDGQVIGEAEAGKPPITAGRKGSRRYDRAAGSERVGNPQLIINHLPVL
jgi:hypothetical protein